MAIIVILLSNNDFLTEMLVKWGNCSLTKQHGCICYLDKPQWRLM